MEGVEKPKDLIEKLKEYLPEAVIERIKLEDIPEPVLEIFERKSHSLIKDEDYKQGNFEDLFKIVYSEKEIIFAASQNKTYHNGETEDLVYLVDTINGEMSGYSELRMALTKQTEFFKDKPFVGFTQTEEPLRGLGIGETRLRIMNSIAHAKYGHPLHSDTLLQESAKRIWERLVENGEAEKFSEGEHERFRFKE